MLMMIMRAWILLFDYFHHHHSPRRYSNSNSHFRDKDKVGARLARYYSLHTETCLLVCGRARSYSQPCSSGTEAAVCMNSAHCKLTFMSTASLDRDLLLMATSFESPLPLQQRLEPSELNIWPLVRSIGTRRASVEQIRCRYLTVVSILIYFICHHLVSFLYHHRARHAQQVKFFLTLLSGCSPDTLSCLHLFQVTLN